MSEPEQNQKSENRHASFSGAYSIASAVVNGVFSLAAQNIVNKQASLELAESVISSMWPGVEKHFRQKFENERQNPQATDTISNKINALAGALHEVEKTVEGGQARYKTQSDDTKESILKALSVLAFEARKECRPSQVVNAEKLTQKYPDAYYNLDHIAKRITNKAKLYPNLLFDDLQKEIRADLNVLEEKL